MKRVLGANRAKLIKLLLLSLFGVLLGFFTLLLVDTVLGIYLNKTGYFKATYPLITTIFDTNEFQVQANISAQGIRNEMVKVPKPAGTLRILSLGDSFVYGWGVALENTWVKLLEKRLNQQFPEKKIEIINAGLPGASLQQLVQVCQAYKDQFNPDLVIVALYADDFYQTAAAELNTPRWERLLKESLPILSRINQPIISPTIIEIDRDKSLNNQELTVSTTFVWKNYIRSNRLLNHPTLLNRLSPKIRSDLLNGKVNPGFVLWAVRDANFLLYLVDGRFEVALNSSNIQMAKLKTSCLSDIETIVIYMPSSEQVSEYYHQFKKDLGFNVEQGLVSVNTDPAIKKMVEDRGFKYLSLLPYLRSIDCQDCYYHWDIHFTKEGNKKAVEYLLPEIEKIILTLGNKR